VTTVTPASRHGAAWHALPVDHHGGHQFQRTRARSRAIPARCTTLRGSAGQGRRPQPASDSAESKAGWQARPGPGAPSPIRRRPLAVTGSGWHPSLPGRVTATHWHDSPACCHSVSALRTRSRALALGPSQAGLSDSAAADRTGRGSRPSDDPRPPGLRLRLAESPAETRSLAY
jgi:hypothetical protein